ncbi:MAG: ATP-dependent DNA ligase [Myxococcales bacterium]|nr:ATP-dependent DNA ligase [Myxococcales bacterium]
MKRFAALYRALDGATATSEKVSLLEAYVREVSRADAAWAVYLLLDKKKSALSSGALRQRFLEASAMPEWLFEECRGHVGDTAETVALLLHALPRSDGTDESREALAALPLSTWMEDELPRCPRDDVDKQRAALVRWWSALSPWEALALNKVLTGAFRVGVSGGLVQRAVASALGVELSRVQRALTGDFAPSAALLTDLESSTAAADDSKPYPFLLAHPLEDDFVFDPARWQLEYKWDGIRGQVIKRAGQLFLWSRGEELVTPSFPDLREPLSSLPDGTAIDGEILAWSTTDDAPAPFATLQTRLQRKNLTPAVLRGAPARVVAYDLLELGGEDLRERPLAERRAALEKLVTDVALPVLSISAVLEAKSREELEALREAAHERGAEGLMLKDRESVYGIGRKRGVWWKHKREPMTVDAVLVYAQAGSGRRANLFTDYTFALWKGDELVSFAKAYSGLSDEELAELDKWIRKNTREKHGPVRVVEPELVFELAFEGIAKSARHKSGLAVRFPRILRWRRDKPAREADSVTLAEALLNPPK